MIHSTAVIHPDADIGEDVAVGPYACIEAGVRIGPRCRIGAHAIIEGPTQMGPDNTVGPHAVVGTAPQDIGYRDEPTRLEIGARNHIREFATLHRGSPKDRGVTTVGDDNLFMAYAHVGHDCIVGNHVIMANSAMLGGHVIVEDGVNMSAMCGIHQFVRIGEYAMLGGGTMTTMDIPPYAMVSGNHARLYGLNRRGLKRAGFPPEHVQALRTAYRIVFGSGKRLAEALAELEQRHDLDNPRVRHLAQFLGSSTRGITR
ncbi:acyl-ACP--UDP-N-acetylglucosamine O-acyltransferase [Aquisalimonas lutea]|uniref:acyl-ACP--UDP-N-acetylglucosamine O-acyltransferase n=1 Tax=Aquisalimonas lutea TaxID=1327750 RepID=UPI0025B4AFE0|nr:acyl-ACP--UDP-N-acetylglucosamine O-acyltransferase [Aquisalimonas lutea]MDN3518395.1 acyl-ACP--UDP-N-acetylglucosamine O-acyltransferase [Aquisalimonas lutea]